MLQCDHAFLPHCRLCLASNALIRSHIVPRWFMKNVKGSNGQYVYVDLNAQTERNQQTDFQEPLLCGPCDRSFSNVESSVRLLHRRWMAYPRPGNGRNVPLPRSVNVPYTTVKLFALLTLWRMSISSHEEYSHIQLSAQIQEDLRLKLQSQDPGRADEFPVFAVVDTTGGLKQSFQTPKLTEMGLVWFAAGAYVGVLFDPNTGAVPQGWSMANCLGDDGTLPLQLVDVRKDPLFERALSVWEASRGKD